MATKALNDQRGERRLKKLNQIGDLLEIQQAALVWPSSFSASPPGRCSAAVCLGGTLQLVGMTGTSCLQEVEDVFVGPLIRCRISVSERRREEKKVK